MALTRLSSATGVAARGLAEAGVGEADAFALGGWAELGPSDDDDLFASWNRSVTDCTVDKIEGRVAGDGDLVRSMLEDEEYDGLTIAGFLELDGPLKGRGLGRGTGLTSGGSRWGGIRPAE